MERGSNYPPFSISGATRHHRAPLYQQPTVHESLPLATGRLSSASCGAGSAPVKNTRERLTGAPGEFSLSLESESTATSAFGSSETVRQSDVRYRQRASVTQFNDYTATSQSKEWSSPSQQASNRLQASSLGDCRQSKNVEHPHGSGVGYCLRVLFFTVVAILCFPVLLFSRWRPMGPTVPVFTEPLPVIVANTTQTLEDPIFKVSAAQSEMRATLDATLKRWKSLEERDVQRSKEIALLQGRVDSLQEVLQAVRSDTQGIFEDLETLRALADKQQKFHDTLNNFKTRVDALEHRQHNLGEDVTATRKRAEKAHEMAAAAVEKPHCDKQTCSVNGPVQPADTSELSKIKKMLFNVQRLVYDDGTGTPDWARASLGGSIVTQFTSAPRRTSAWNSIKWKIISFFPRYYGKALPPPRPADVVIGSTGAGNTHWGGAAWGTITPTPGNCFAFDGAHGNITIRLPTLLNVTEVHVDHVSPNLVMSVAAAPQDFAVYVDDCQRLPCTRRVNFPFPPSKRVGSFRFEHPKKGLSSQTFVLRRGTQDPHLFSRRLRFEFLTNHGGDYTCIYRLRVHGQRFGVQA